MAEKSSIFDMIGPVMIGPSSSHTAGVVRIASAAIRILGSLPTHATVTFYNSFARTYEGHGSDRAIVGGLLGFATDDERIRESLDHARTAGLTYTFQSVGQRPRPCTRTRLSCSCATSAPTTAWKSWGRAGAGASSASWRSTASPADFSTALHTLIVDADDRTGAIAFIASVIAHDDCNIATMSVSRKGRHDQARQFIEMDSGLSDITLQYLRHLRWVHRVTYIPSVE